MAGGTRYLVQRGHRFQVRFPIPKELQAKFGRSELRWSLGTSNPRQARDKALRATLTFYELCASVQRMGDISEARVRQLVRSFFEQLKNEYVPASGLPFDQGGIEEERQAWVVDLMSDLKKRISTNDPDSQSFVQAKKLAGIAGSDFDELSSARKHQLIMGVMQARVEELEHWMIRRSEPVAKYTPKFDVFNEDDEPETPVQSIAHAPQANSSKPASENTPKLYELIEEYISTGSSVGITGSPWAEKTTEDYRNSLSWFKSSVGSNISVVNLNTSHVSNFRNGLLRMRVGASPKLKLSDAQTDDLEKRTSAKTAWKRFAAVRGFLNWLEAQDHVPSAPGKKLKIATPGKADSEKRRSFESAEVKKLFSSPIYRGHHSEDRRHIPGDRRVKDGYFWSFLLLFYTGARLGEIIQLSPELVRQKDTIWYFAFTSSEMKLKTNSSDRLTPIHSDLVSFGFLEFVEKQKQAGESLLFPELVRPTGGSGYASKQLNRYLDRIGLDDPLIVLHSFRHTLKDIARNSGVPEDAHDRMTGHAPKSVGASYGAGHSLETLSKYLEQMVFPLTKEVRAILSSQDKK